MEILEAIAEKPLTNKEIGLATNLSSDKVRRVLRDTLSVEDSTLGFFSSSSMSFPDGTDESSTISVPYALFVNGLLECQVFDGMVPAECNTKYANAERHFDYFVLSILREDAKPVRKYWHADIKSYAEKSILEYETEIFDYIKSLPDIVNFKKN